MNDVYKTIAKPSEAVIFKEKGSKFYGYGFPVNSEAAVKTALDALKNNHHKARHFCYAYQIGTDQNNLYYRVNDDGEPNNSAGMPIYGQIQAFKVTNVLIVVIRYFGGVKLGVGGLIQAYKTTAQITLEASKIVSKTIHKNLMLIFDYKHLNTVMRVINENNLKIIKQESKLDCRFTITVRKKNSDAIRQIFTSIFGVEVKSLY